jgi:hypothetical protein
MKGVATVQRMLYVYESRQAYKAVNELLGHLEVVKVGACNVMK